MNHSKRKFQVHALTYPSSSGCAKVDHFEILGMHSHRSGASFGSDLRNLRESPQSKGHSFGTRLADVLVDSLPVVIHR